MTAPVNFKFNITKGSEKRLIVLREAVGESLQHIILKLLAYLLFFDDNLQVEIEAFQHYKPDLVKFDEEQNWKVTKWIDCGVIDDKKLLKISKHNRQAEIYIFKNSKDSAQSLKDKVAKKTSNTSNIRYCAFNKEELKIIQELMAQRNEIIIENYSDIRSGRLDLIFNNERISIKWDCF